MRSNSSFQTFTAVMYQVEVFFVVTQCSDVGYQRFGGPPHQSTSPRRGRQYGPLKRWYPTTTLHDVTTQEDLELRMKC